MTPLHVKGIPFENSNIYSRRRTIVTNGQLKPLTACAGKNKTRWNLQYRTLKPSRDDFNVQSWRLQQALQHTSHTHTARHYATYTAATYNTMWSTLHATTHLAACIIRQYGHASMFSQPATYVRSKRNRH